MLVVEGWWRPAGWVVRLGVGRAVDRRCENGEGVVVMWATAQREGSRAGRWALRAVGLAWCLFRGQSEQAVAEFVFLGPALQVQADQFEAAAADVVAESQAHQQCGDQRTINVDHHACGFVAQQMTAAQHLFEEAEEQFDERSVLSRNLRAGRAYLLDRGYERYTLFNDIVAAKSDDVCRVQHRALAVVETRELSPPATRA